MTKLLTPMEIAELLKISYDSALAFIKYSGIHYIKIGRQYRVSEDTLAAFLSKAGHTYVDLGLPFR